MKIRSKSWGAANLSWSVVIEELLFAAERMGHETVFESTNGHQGMTHWTPEKSLRQDLWARQFVRDGGRFDLDLTYTVPQNFHNRFLKSSKCRAAVYAYESSIMPERWKKDYHHVDFVFPPSKYCAEMIERNGCPAEKIKVIPHGVDVSVFNTDAKPIDLKLDRSVKFLCVAEPHYRKQLDKLLDVYCEAFTAEDDVCLVMKTKVFKTPEDIKSMRGFEMNIMPHYKKLKMKYGNRMPKVQFISQRLNNIAGLYAACDAFALMTASEGWGVPYLEALAMGLPVIAPRHGGQLDFLNDHNAVLTPCGTRRARKQEQYWGYDPKAIVGAPDEKAFGEAMRKMYEDLRAIKAGGINVEHEHRRFVALATANSLTWTNAIKQILDITEGHNDRL